MFPVGKKTVFESLGVSSGIFHAVNSIKFSNCCAPLHIQKTLFLVGAFSF